MAKSFVTNPNAFASTLLLECIQLFGADIFEWEPETLERCLNERYGDVPKCNIQKVQAALGLYTSNLFWVDPVSFGLACRVFNRHRIPYAGSPDIEDVCWGVTEAELIYEFNSGDEEDGDIETEQFSDAVKRLIIEIMHDAGLYKTPETLDFVHSDLPDSDIHDDGMLLAREQDQQIAADSCDNDVMSTLLELMIQLREIDGPFTEQARAEINNILEQMRGYNANA